LSLKLKSLFYEKFVHLFSKYNRIIIVKADNVGSQQLQKCRKALGNSSVLILGKNTIIRKVLKQQIKKNPGLKDLLSHVSGNIGFIFTKINPLDVREILSSNKVPAPAKVGQIAQTDVIIPSGPTGITPDGTPFFQALNIPTKISKGQIEIQEEVRVITSGKLIQSSEVALLQKLNIVPFSYELEIEYIYDDEECYDPSVLDISSQKIRNILKEKVQELKFISKKTGYPVWGSPENSLKKSIASFLSIGLAIDYQPFKASNETCSITQKTEEEEISQIEKPCPPKKEVTESSSETGDFGLGLFD